MSDKVMPRASGQTAGEEEAIRQGAQIDQDLEQAHLPVNDESSERKYRTPGFHRMRFEMTPEQREIADSAIKRADELLHEKMPEAFEILDEINFIVREPLVGPDGPIFDADGKQMWVKNASGRIHEDYTKLTLRQREHFSFQIMTWLATWEQKAGDIWIDSMFARVAWEEKFAIDYDTPRNKTMGERDAIAKRGAIDERYYAVFAAGVSRKFDALVRTMRNIGTKMEKPNPL